MKPEQVETGSAAISRAAMFQLTSVQPGCSLCLDTGMADYAMWGIDPCTCTRVAQEEIAARSASNRMDAA